MKDKFDEAGLVIQDYINNDLIPNLEEAGIDNVVQSTDIQHIRLNQDKVIKTSTDGVVYEASG